MATATQIKALLNGIKEGDVEHLRAVALQIAANEEKKGHVRLAKEIKSIVSNLSFPDRKNLSSRIKEISFIEPTKDLEGLFEADYSKVKVNNLILSNSLRKKINRIITEQNSKNKLRAFNLVPRGKILLTGAPGTGKTMTAKALAGELRLPIFIVQLDRLITKYMGETASKLRLIFDQIQKVRGVYFFDEFDAIGGSRDLGNDVGEIRRVLNTFLQFIENASTDRIILAATNYAKLLDKALFRRFDDVLLYQLPCSKLRLETFKYQLRHLDISEINWDEVLKVSDGLSFDEITKICNDVHKIRVLDSYQKIPTSIILSCIKEKKNPIES